MNVQNSPSRSGYNIDVRPLEGRVTLYRDATILATSTRALVMYETRLRPTIYFPRDDVMVDLTEMSDLRTFCPFRGTARYNGIKLDGDILENAVWSYEKPLPEGRIVDGHVAFMPNAYTHVDLGDNQLLEDQNASVSGPLIDWLFRDASAARNSEQFTRSLAEAMMDHGIPVSRMTVMVWSLHPQIAAYGFTWKRDEPELTTVTPSYEMYDHPDFLNSPLRHVSAGLGGVRQRLDEPRFKASFPIMEDLRAQGATDYVAMPLPFSDGRKNVLTLTSDHPDGFSTNDLGTIFECITVISRYYEVFSQRWTAQALLETYLGKRTGARVLGGEIRRGDGDEIDAAIMFCDLRGSTRLEEQLDRRAYIALLNRFFDTVSDVVHAHGGEVLKFIGDAVLAVFPQGETANEAATEALIAAREIVAQIDAKNIERPDTHADCVIGIDFGRVTYGNVGSQQRLDFTVIGQAANIAARLAEQGKYVDRRIVLSDTVAGCCPNLTEIGEIELRNVSEPVMCFAGD